MPRPLTGHLRWIQLVDCTSESIHCESHPTFATGSCRASITQLPQQSKNKNTRPLNPSRNGKVVLRPLLVGCLFKQYCALVTQSTVLACRLGSLANG
uniref:Uncharacterized protein n=1 Tax=Rhipicephalus zambeziensis TaxID=60191 RepID=A0A224YHT8_9ACAR